VAYKNKSLKRQIINYLDSAGNSTITDLSAFTGISIPKTTALVNELIEDGLLAEQGKIDSTGGRRASIFGLVASSCYFLGVDVRRYHVNIGLVDFKKNTVRIDERIPFELSNSELSYQQLVSLIRGFVDSLEVDRAAIISAGINLSGRINTLSGYSYSYFHLNEVPLAEQFRRDIGITTFIENDSRAMAYGEFFGGTSYEVKDALFVNMDYGLGLGILTDGKMYYGKSGFSGEIGHVPMFQNEIICHCGKKGCLETEASGWALLRQFRERVGKGVSSLVMQKIGSPEDIQLEDIVEGARIEDVLCIELLSDLGEKIGRALAFLINIFNPEMVIIGGTLSQTGDYLRLPMRSTVNKLSLGLVNSDTQLRMSRMGETAGVVGGALLARHKLMKTLQ
ncbi:MAG: ROK family transcriptional regulator, partial [Chitinophagaceae bacterium]|nr:ROK family transcriptional regulator [Chitinophagaceae bacterium]